jgi:hypothetical protein
LLSCLFCFITCSPFRLSSSLSDLFCFLCLLVVKTLLFAVLLLLLLYLLAVKTLLLAVRPLLVPRLLAVGGPSAYRTSDEENQEISAAKSKCQNAETKVS